MNLSDFKLRSSTFEFRYEPAYLLWDRTGKIWSEAKTKWPNIESTHVEPNRQSFTDREKRHNFQAEMEKAFVIASDPDPNLEEFAAAADFFEQTIREILELHEYSRLGFRVAYFKQYPTRKEAVEDFVNGTPLRPFIPKEKLFNVDGGPIETGYFLRLEDADIGATVQMRVDQIRINYKPPVEIENVEPQKIEKNGIVFDVDSYTIKPVGVHQLKTSEWIGQAFRLFKRDSKAFLGG